MATLGPECEAHVSESYGGCMVGISEAALLDCRARLLLGVLDCIGPFGL